MSDTDNQVEKTTETVVETKQELAPPPLGTATEAYRNDPVQNPAVVPTESAVVEKTTVTETQDAGSSES